MKNALRFTGPHEDSVRRHAEEKRRHVRGHRAIERYGLPLPNHLRFDEDTPVASVLAAATGVVNSDRLKTMFVTLAEEDYAALKGTLESLAWSEGLHKPISRNRLHLLFFSGNVRAARR